MNKYLLPKDVYHRTQWLIRGYPRLKFEYENSIGSSPEIDGQPHGSAIGNPTERDALKLANISDDLHAIERGLSKIPEEYRKGILDAIIYHMPYPDSANISTWKRWRQRLVYFVAKAKCWI